MYGRTERRSRATARQAASGVRTVLPAALAPRRHVRRPGAAGACRAEQMCDEADRAPLGGGAARSRRSRRRASCHRLSGQRRRRRRGEFAAPGSPGVVSIAADVLRLLRSQVTVPLDNNMHHLNTSVLTRVTPQSLAAAGSASCRATRSRGRPRSRRARPASTSEMHCVKPRTRLRASSRPRPPRPGATYPTAARPRRAGRRRAAGRRGRWWRA